MGTDASLELLYKPRDHENYITMFNRCFYTNQLPADVQEAKPKKETTHSGERKVKEISLFFPFLF